jgi:hypothetical protein
MMILMVRTGVCPQEEPGDLSQPHYRLLRDDRGWDHSTFMPEVCVCTATSCPACRPVDCVAKAAGLPTAVEYYHNVLH